VLLQRQRERHHVFGKSDFTEKWIEEIVWTEFVKSNPELAAEHDATMKMILGKKR
jgi:hypothetical protein